MPTQTQDTELQELFQKRLRELPQVVQNAIRSADVQKRLRNLADTNKLHLDQWQILENEVMLTVLGFQQIESLEKNIKDQVGVSDEIAHALTESANQLIFEPIRAELERELEHPEAHVEEVSGVEAAQQQILAEAKETQTSVVTPEVAPATPPTPAPEVKVARPSESTAYKPGEASSQRGTVHDDPYRVPPV